MTGPSVQINGGNFYLFRDWGEQPDIPLKKDMYEFLFEGPNKKLAQEKFDQTQQEIEKARKALALFINMKTKQLADYFNENLY